MIIPEDKIIIIYLIIKCHSQDDENVLANLYLLHVMFNDVNFNHLIETKAPLYRPMKEPRIVVKLKNIVTTSTNGGEVAYVASITSCAFTAGKLLDSRDT